MNFGAQSKLNNTIFDLQKLKKKDHIILSVDTEMHLTKFMIFKKKNLSKKMEIDRTS